MSSFDQKKLDRARENLLARFHVPPQTLMHGYDQLWHGVTLPEGFILLPALEWQATRHRLKCALKGISRLKIDRPTRDSLYDQIQLLRRKLAQAIDDRNRHNWAREKAELLGPEKLQAANQEVRKLTTQCATLTQDRLNMSAELDRLRDENRALIATLGRLSTLVDPKVP